ncbi:MAG TPA: ribokinase [Acetobacteraceae bacterium]|nr:ribokinase [Acetobacteraceae bacterium]
MRNLARPVLVIGSLNMDLVVRCERLPSEGETVFGSDFFTAFGGKGANQAVAAARLGARVAMAGCVGHDQFGTDLIAGLAAAGVQTGSVLVADRPTGTALITVNTVGANTIVVVSGANMACGKELIDQAMADAATPGVLLLQHEIPAAANEYAIRAAKAAGWFIVLNPAPARAVPPDLLPLIDIIAPNETEAAMLTGRSIAGRADALAAVDVLLARGAGAVLITLGRDGAVYRDAKRALHCPALPVQAVDTTAAGDAYLGALGAALAEGNAVEQGLGFAAAAAGLAVTRLGAQPSLGTRAEVTAFIARYGQPQPVSVPG